jgi:hypothetical protein
MRKLEKELLNRGEISIFLEVEDVSSPQRFISEIVMALVDNEKIRHKTNILTALRDEEIDEKLIDKVYYYRILGNQGKHYFEHYSQRLRILYQGMGGMEEKAARALLRKICSVDYYPINLAFGIYKQETGIDDYDSE